MKSVYIETSIPSYLTEADALHVAIASVHAIDYLLTVNHQDPLFKSGIWDAMWRGDVQPANARFCLRRAKFATLGHWRKAPNEEQRSR